jgi:nicotinamidase-related amidase
MQASNRNTTNRSKTALVVVDMMEDNRSEPFFGKLFRNERVAERIKAVALEARAARIPIILVGFYSKKVDERIAKAAGPDAIVITKKRLDAFNVKKFRKTLEKLGVETIALCGYNRVCCVLETTNGAINAGYNVITSNLLMYSNGFFEDGEIEHAKAALHYIKKTDFHLTVGGFVKAMKEFANGSKHGS